MLVTELFPDRFFAVKTLRPDHIRMQVISFIQEPMKDDGSRGDMVWVMRFRDQELALVVKPENAAKLGEIIGNDTDLWLGQFVGLKEGLTTFNGKPTACVSPCPPMETKLYKKLLDNLPKAEEAKT